MNKPPGTKMHFDDLPTYRCRYETPYIPTFFDFARMSGRSVLAVGVENGIDAFEMARAGAHYTGIDITERHLELTRLYFDVNRLSEPKLLKWDLLTLAIPGRFDFVYSFGVLHHVPQEGHYLERFRGLLADGGRLLNGVYSKYSLLNTYLVATCLARAIGAASLDTWRSHIAERSTLGDPVAIRIRFRHVMTRLMGNNRFEMRRYKKPGFVQGPLRIFGRYCAPSGPVLAAFGKMLGWYHLFACRAAQEA